MGNEVDPMGQIGVLPAKHVSQGVDGSVGCVGFNPGNVAFAQNVEALAENYTPAAITISLTIQRAERET